MVSKYSETSPYGHLVITATLFWPPGKTAIHFLVKKTLVNGVTPNTAKYFWPIGDRINGVPLHVSSLFIVA